MGADEANVVHLVGRVSAVLDERVLPSGDTVLPLRVVVPRQPTAGPVVSSGSRATVDVIDVACWSPSTRRVAARLEPGDRVEVDGSLHRRFFRGGGGVQSRYEVTARRLSRLEQLDPATRRGPAKRGRTGLGANAAGSPAAAPIQSAAGKRPKAGDVQAALGRPMS